MTFSRQLLVVAGALALASTTPALSQATGAQQTAQQPSPPAAAANCPMAGAGMMNGQHMMAGGGMGNMQGMMNPQMMQQMQQMHADMQKLHGEMMQMRQEMRRYRGKTR